MRIDLGILNGVQKYRRIKESGTAATSKRFGVEAILLSLLAAALLLLFIRIVFCVVLQFKLNHGAVSILALLFLLAAGWGLC